MRTSEKPSGINNKIQMTRILNMPAMATEGTTVCYTVTHDDLIDFAREIIERTKEMDEAEKTAVELKADIAEKKQRCDYLGLQIRDREAELGTVLKKLQTTSSLGRRPEKGVLGYRSDEVENYVQATEAIV